MRIFAINLLVLAAMALSAPVFAEASSSENLNVPKLSDNLDTSQRLIIRLYYIKDLALDNLRHFAPNEVEQLDNCLELVKQLTDKWELSVSFPKIPLISPLQNWLPQ